MASENNYDSQHLGITAKTFLQQYEEVLKESEKSFPTVMKNKVYTSYDIGNLALGDIIDDQAIQSLMDDFYKLTHIGVSIADIKGKVLITTGWQDICTKFHRVHPETSRYCIESDTILSNGVSPGEFKLYKCKNNMCDIVTPIMVDGKHLGNLFLGQFLFVDEKIDYEIFKYQACKYGFDEEKYLSALESIPRWSHETVDTAMKFYIKFANMLSMLSYKNIRLARLLSEREYLINALKEREDQYRGLFEHAGVAIGYYKLDGTVISYNKKAAENMGGQPEEYTGKSIYDIFPRYDADFYMGRIIKAASSDSPQEYEDYISLSSGSKWIFSTFNRIIDSNDNIFGIQIISQDITERKGVEVALKESEEKYRFLITQMQQALAVCEVILDVSGKAVDYRFIDVNESYERLTGRKHNNIIGKTILEIMPDTESYVIEKLGHVALTGEPIQYENYSKELDKYLETVAYSPQPRQIAIIISDITKRKRLETALTQEKKLLETTLISVGDGVISTDNKGNIVFLNKVAESLTGWTQEVAKGKPIEEVLIIVNEFTREKSENTVKKVLLSGKTIELANHVMLISKDGIERYIQNIAAPIVQENGEVLGVVLVFRDFSEKKKKQEEIEHLSYHDQLTGLYNRRYFDNVIRKLSEEKCVPLTLAVADVNGLKLTNDAFGHKVGDTLLETVARILKKECRSEDIVARIGGDEFVILLPETDFVNAGAIISRVNAAISKEKIENVILSVSIGFAVKQDISDDINNVFKQAEDEMYKHKLSDSLSMRSRTINLIMNTLYEKNNSREKKHSKRVSKICEAIASRMKFNEDDVNHLRLAGLMHDIGIIGIDENILMKPRKLNWKERNEVERHSEIGYRILSSVNEFSKLANYVLEHHERWDGKGYPRGLKGEEISLQARIIAIADAYDSMTSHRSFRKTLSEEEAINELKRCSGKQFDPNFVNIFIDMVLGKE